MEPAIKFLTDQPLSIYASDQVVGLFLVLPGYYEKSLHNISVLVLSAL